MSEMQFSFRRMVRKYVNSSFILVFVTLLALIIANSSWATAYSEIWTKPVALQFGDFNFFSHHGEPMTFMDVINDFLMAIFFFSVGLEIKREILVGELSSLKKSLLPVIGACGGMLIPVLFYYFTSSEGLSSKGCAIPMATDIAFSLGILSMLGKRVPTSLKIFLAALAVADDLGGIIVIALFYSSEIYATYLIYAAIVIIGLIIGAYMNIRSKMFYCGLGLLVWYLFLNSGIHATIAGVIVAFCVPARPATTSSKYIEKIREAIKQFPITKEHSGEIHILTNQQISLLKSVESSSDKVISPLQDLEDSLASIVNFIIIPIFAFANAGVNISGFSIGSLFEGVALSVFLGLVFGKVIGIFSFAWLAIKLKIVNMPVGVDWKMLFGVSMLGGIGFTVSMFIANLSFAGHGEEGLLLLNEAKLGILAGSVIAGAIGYTLLHKFLPQVASPDTDFADEVLSVDDV